MIANLAGEGVHPNDHVNMGQSSNDVFPSAVHLAAVDLARSDLLPALERLAGSFQRKADEWADVVKAGRTHMMDAVPVTLGQEFGGYAAQLTLGRDRVQDALGRASEIPLGGTATGTGLNTHPEFAERVREKLGLGEAPRDRFEAQANRDALVELHGALKVVAVSLTKIANDLVLMGSGPAHRPRRAAAARAPEGLVDHARQGQPGDPRGRAPGRRAGDRQRHRRHGRRHAGRLRAERARADDRPQPVRVDPHPHRGRAPAVRASRGRAEANEEVLRRHAESTPAIATALNPHIGYDLGTEIVKEAVASERTIREVALEKGVDERILDEALDLRAMTRGAKT